MCGLMRTPFDQRACGLFAQFSGHRETVRNFAALATTYLDSKCIMIATNKKRKEDHNLKKSSVL